MKGKGLGTQKDGHHYTDMKLQPLELAYMLGETPCFTKVAKYLTRVKNDKFINIDKAAHCILVEVDLSRHVGKYAYTSLNRLYYKYFKRGKLHHLIEEFTDEPFIQLALHFMFIKDYEEAAHYIGLYRKSQEKLNEQR